MPQADVLNRLPIFSGLTPTQAANLASIAEEVRFEQDQVILKAGDPSEYLYTLTSGCVRVEVRAKAFTYCVQELGEGEVFGWSALLGHHDTLFQVRARDASRALRLRADELSTIFRGDPALEATLLRQSLRVAADRIEATETKLGELFGLDMAAANGSSHPDLVGVESTR
jgi:CRP-like cAMP-binding protein